MEAIWPLAEPCALVVVWTICSAFNLQHFNHSAQVLQCPHFIAIKNSEIRGPPLSGERPAPWRRSGLINRIRDRHNADRVRFPLSPLVLGDALACTNQAPYCPRNGLRP